MERIKNLVDKITGAMDAGVKKGAVSTQKMLKASLSLEGFKEFNNLNTEETLYALAHTMGAIIFEEQIKEKIKERKNIEESN